MKGGLASEGEGEGGGMEKGAGRLTRPKQIALLAQPRELGAPRAQVRGPDAVLPAVGGDEVAVGSVSERG